MSEFKCFRGFTSRTGNVYTHGTIISEAEYDKLHYVEKVFFLRISGTPRYRQPSRDDNETFPVVLPVSDRPDTSDWTYDVRHDTRPETNPDEPSYGGGSFGGAGAGSDYDRDDSSHDTYSSNDDSSDSSSDSGSSNNDD